MRNWLKEIRLAKNMTGKEVGIAAGISESYYLMIEAGQRGRPLNVDIAKAIAKALGFEWVRFYEEKELKLS